MKLKIKKKYLKKKLKVLSICTGVGGIELGFDPEKFAVIGHSEIDEHCNSVLRYRFPRMKNYGDISEADKSNLPDFDILIGGTPCQDLSIAGKRRGITGGRSGLFFDFVEVLKIKRPKYFIWENVKGAFTSNRGWDFARVQMELVDAGYDIRWELLNAKDYGVPQSRERVFIAGCKRGEGVGEIFREANGHNSTVSKDSEQEGVRDGKNSKKLIFVGGVGNKWNKVSEKNQSRDFKQGNRVYDARGISPSIPSQGGNKAGGSILVAYSKSTRENHIDHRARLDETANTLSTGDGCRSMSTANFIVENMEVRKLTPTECERLMGWPDDHTKWGINLDGEKYELSDTTRYRQCGNGVVTPCITAILDRLIP